MIDTMNGDAPTAEKESYVEDQESGKGHIDWEDPSVPIGDAPSLPKWPVAVSALVWACWIALLVVMLVSPRSVHFH